MLRDLIEKNRSYRRFDESARVERETLLDLVDLARLSASAANRQPLRYLLCHSPEDCAAVFPHLAWAGYLSDWDGPAPGERPAAYIVILSDRRVSRDPGCDHGIAAQSILLGAVERGLGGCMIGAIQRDALREALGIAGDFEITLVVALGRPAERVEIETADRAGDIRYWRDDAGVHHVPKRRLEELIVERGPCEN